MKANGCIFECALLSVVSSSRCVHDVFSVRDECVANAHCATEMDARYATLHCGRCWLCEAGGASPERGLSEARTKTRFNASSLLRFRPTPHPFYTTNSTMADRQSAYSISIFGSHTVDGADNAAAPSRVQQALVDFIMEFTLDNVFIYR
jgi:hypothetical protein